MTKRRTVPTCRYTLKGFLCPVSAPFALTAVIWLMLSFVEVTFAATIKDLAPAAAEYKAASFLVERKIMDVDANFNFKPSLLITKLDLAKYLYNLIIYYKLETPGATPTDELTKLRDRVSSIEKQLQSINVSTLSNEIANLKKTVSTLENRTAALEGKQPATPQNLATITTELEALRKRVTDLEGRLQKLDSTDLTSLRTQLGELHKRLQTVESRLSLVEGRAGTGGTNVSQITLDVETLKRRVAELENRLAIPTLGTDDSRLERLRSDLANLETKVLEIEKVGRQFSDISKGLEQLRSRLSELEISLKQRVDQLERFAKLTQEATGILAKLSSDFPSLADKVAKIESDLTELKKKPDELQGRIGEVENRLRELRSTLEEVKFQVNKFSLFESSLEDKASARELKDLENRYNETVREVKDARTRLIELETDLNAIKRRVGEIQTSLGNTVEALAKLEKKEATDFENLQRQVEDLSKKISEISERVALLQRQIHDSIGLSDRIQKLETAVNLSEDLIRQLAGIDPLNLVNFISSLQVVNNRLDQLETRFENLRRDSMDSIDSRLKAVEAELVRVRETDKDLSQLQTKVNQTSSDQQRLNSDLVATNKKLEELRGEVERFKWLAIVGLSVSVVLALIFMTTAR